MAFLTLKSGGSMVLHPEPAERLWRVLAKEIKGTKDEQKLAARVKRLYLNPANAPESYAEEMASSNENVQARLPYVD